jgi:PAS domain S-box-containing protein
MLSKNNVLFTERRYRRLYETTQDGIMARNVEGKMIDCNQAYAKMLGYTKKELKNLTVQDLLPEKWHEQREKIVNKVLQTGRSIVFEREY